MDSQNEQIIEYLRGELEGAELAAFEELLANDATFRKELEKQKNLWNLFGKLPEVDVSERLKEKTLYAVKHYKNKSMKIRVFRVEDKIEQLKKKETRRLFTPVSAAAAILILAAVIITILLSENVMKMEEAEYAADTAKMAYEAPKAKNALTDNANVVADEEEEESLEFMDEELDEGAWNSDFDMKKEGANNDPAAEEKPLEAIPNLDKNSGPWPNAKLGNGFGGSGGSVDRKGALPPGKVQGEIDDDIIAPAEDAEESTGKDEGIAENMKSNDSSNTYAFFIDLNNSMNEKLTTNQMLNLPYELNGKVSTRFDLAKYEIAKDLNNLDKSDKFVVVVFRGVSAYVLGTTGRLKSYNAGSDLIVATKDNVSSSIKALDQQKPNNYGRSDSDVLNTAFNLLNASKNEFSNVKFFTVGNEPARSAKKEESRNGYVEDDAVMSSNVEIIDLGGTGGLQGWASEHGFSYSPR